MTFQPPPPQPGPPPQGPPPQGPIQGPPPQGPFQGPPPQGPFQGPPPGQPAGGWAPPPGQQPMAPQAPVQGGYGPPAGGHRSGSGSFDPKTVNALDWGILAAGVLAFIFSFVSYYTVSAGPLSASENAWHGFFGWFAMLLALIGSAAIAVELFAPQVKLPAPARLVALGCYAVATLCVILALFIVPIDTTGFSGLSTGHGVGYWLSLIVIIAGLVLSWLRFTQTGGTLPIGGKRPGSGPAPLGPPR